MDRHRKLGRWGRVAFLVALLSAGSLASVHYFRTDKQGGVTHPPPPSPKLTAAVASADSTPVIPDANAQNSQPAQVLDQPFRAWISEYSALPAGSPERKNMLPAGIELAKARRPAMEKLIREDPRRAVADALTFDQWAVLPDEMKAEVERPFSVSSDYTYYPICHEPGAHLQAGEPAYVATLAMPDGSSLQTFSYGRREGVMSKRALPVQGITLAGAAAMRDGTLQIVEAAELTTVRTLFPDGQADMTRSLTSGTPVDGSAVYVHSPADASTPSPARKRLKHSTASSRNSTPYPVRSQPRHFSQPQPTCRAAASSTFPKSKCRHWRSRPRGRNQRSGCS